MVAKEDYGITEIAGCPVEAAIHHKNMRMLLGTLGILAEMKPLKPWHLKILLIYVCVFCVPKESCLVYQGPKGYQSSDKEDKVITERAGSPVGVLGNGALERSTRRRCLGHWDLSRDEAFETHVNQSMTTPMTVCQLFIAIVVIAAA
ncbi:unnamed protein product [Caretta caretta]